VPTKYKFQKCIKQGLGVRIHFAAKICRFQQLATLRYLVFAYWAAAWYTAAMQPFTPWMWTNASWLNQSRLIYVNAVTVKAIECNVFKKTNSFYDIIKQRLSSTCGPREVSTSFQGNLHFFKPCTCMLSLGKKVQ